MKKDPKHLNIAQHNEQTSKFLFSGAKKQYNDWVVTTAFYSAMHYLYYYFLPKKEKEKWIKTFDGLYSEYKFSNETRHEFTKRWVTINSEKSISAYYKSLYDDCKSARYNGYICDNIAAKNSLKKLKDIKKYCTEN